MRRPTRSGPPPGGIGTSRRTGFEGYGPAATDGTSAAAIAGNPLRPRGIAGRSDPIEIVLPHVQVALAGLDHGVFHAQLPREFLHRAPAGVRVLDVGLGVQLEELELVAREAEQLSPAQPLDAEPAVLSEQPAAVARRIVIGWWNHAQRATKALTAWSMRETTLIFYVRKKYMDMTNTTSAPAARKRSVVSDTPGRPGSLGAAEAKFSLRFLKKSSATFFAAASTRREPICASLPPTFAFTS